MNWKELEVDVKLIHVSENHPQYQMFTEIIHSKLNDLFMKTLMQILLCKLKFQKSLFPFSCHNNMFIDWSHCIVFRLACEWYINEIFNEILELCIYL